MHNKFININLRFQNSIIEAIPITNNYFIINLKSDIW